MNQTETHRYLIGFILRLGAWLLDVLIGAIAFIPIMILILGFEKFSEDSILVQGILTLLNGFYQIGFLFFKSATPGKMLMSHQVCDFRTGNRLTIWQCVIRWAGAFLSALPLGLGFFWVVWDKNKRAWHDYLSGTVVVSDSSFSPQEDDRIYVARTVN